MKGPGSATLVAILLAVARPGAAQARFDGVRIWPFVVSSVGEDYPFTIALRGQYRIFADSLVIDVTDGYAMNQVPVTFGPDGKATAIALVAGLGRGTPDSWNLEHESQLRPIAPLLQPGQHAPVPPMHFVLTSIDTAVLADRWLAFQLRVDQHLPIEGFHPGLLTSYACTEEYILGATPASRVRAKAQRQHYANVC